MLYLRTIYILLVSFSFFNGVRAETVLQGALMVVKADEDVIIDDYNQAITLSADGQYQVLSGLTKISAAAENSVLLATSHGAFLEFTGTGSCAFERFEQMILQEEGEQFSLGDCRMILHINKGQLLIDTSEVKNRSFIILETPCGRVSLGNGILIAKINYDENRSRYELSLESIAGEIHFIPNGSKALVINKRQRLLAYG